MPTRLMTADAPFTADATLASSRTSAVTVSTGPSDGLSAWRTAMRTLAPHVASCAARWRPMNPDPPKTVTVVVAIALGPRGFGARPGYPESGGPAQLSHGASCTVRCTEP